MHSQKSRFAGEKILIADDEVVIVELATLLLKKRGFVVLNAYDGQDCLDQVAQHKPALVLLDYMMPVMNGLDALKQIHNQYPDTYVVMFTGKGSEAVAVEVMKAGAVDYLQKPFVNQSLQERIDAILLRRQVEIENRQLLKERELLQYEINQWNTELERRVRQKSYELEQAHKEIIQSAKLATLGHISAGMAHEVRNPLNSINLFTEILLTTEDLSTENRTYLKKIKQEVERIDQILVKMLASSRSDAHESERVSLTAVIQSVLESLMPRIESQQIELRLDLDGQAPPLQADLLEMEQIFTNLIGNALYEMPDGGQLEISLHADAEKLFVKISDSGAGIPQENLQRVFDPFFTTKEKGTGFGLSVVLRIINSCGGTITVESPPGKGACFYLEFPLLPDSVH